MLNRFGFLFFWLHWLDFNQVITSGNDYDKEEEEYYYYDDYGDEDLYDYADYRLMVNIISTALYAVHLFFWFWASGWGCT